MNFTNCQNQDCTAGIDKLNKLTVIVSNMYLFMFHSMVSKEVVLVLVLALLVLVCFMRGEWWRGVVVTSLVSINEDNLR